jgi:hypothetical protein
MLTTSYHQCQHAALIGDHKQLPPLVISQKAEQGKLQTSLFERLIVGNSKLSRPVLAICPDRPLVFRDPFRHVGHAIPDASRYISIPQQGIL